MRQQSLKYEFLAELLGTFLFLFLGMGCVAGLKLAGASYGQWEISIIWGSAVALGAYASGSISGGHLNPVVTLVLSMFKGFPKYKILPYILAQFLGAFLAAFFVYFLYESLFLAKDINSAGIFTTFPHEKVTFFQAFMTEFFITAILIFCIFCFTDEKNPAMSKISPPILIGLVVAVIGGAFGPLTGFAMNAARDLGPRFFLYSAGWGEEVFTGGLAIPYYIVPLVAPIVGGIFGAMIYRFFMTPFFKNKNF